VSQLEASDRGHGLRLRDLLAESVAGILQRPGRSTLTTLGTVLGVGAFVAVLGLTSTAAGQISRRFDLLKQTSVTITDVGEANTQGGSPSDFPEDADRRINQLNGVIAAGVYWTVPLRQAVIGNSPAVTATSQRNAGDLALFAASAGALKAMHPVILVGRTFDEFHDTRGEPVVVLGATAARRLGISQVVAQPAVFINGTGFTVLGIMKDSQRLPQMLLGIVIPRRTAERLFGSPDPTTGPAQMIVQTRIGAARLIARQAPLALRPDDPSAFQVTPPPDPHLLGEGVGADLSGLFLALAGISLIIGAVGIANTTLVAILERIGEIGLRRALGAHRWHIAAQFLTESTGLGALGGLIGTTLGIAVVVLVAASKHWTAIVNPITVLPAPLIGGVAGMLAGVYPAIRAARLEPADALRR
jgi:putative ABC transport system permease protein